MGVSVLFVCLGNICRSPTAHGVFRDIVLRSDLADSITVDSAGTSDFHVGEAPDPRAMRAAMGRDVDISDLRARQVQARDFERFDYIIAMDRDNLSNLKQLRPTDFSGTLDLFLTFADVGVDEVPDPYYGGERGFDTVLDLCQSASESLLDHIRRQHF